MAVVEFMLNTHLALRLMSISWARLLGQLAPSLLLSAVMFGAILLLQPYIAELHVAVRLMLDISVAVVLYVALAYLFRLRVFKEGVMLFKELIK
jgi:hypothetical protein